MGKQRVKHSPVPRRRRWRWVALVGVLLVTAGVGSFWWFSEAQDTAGGTPRLVLDRTEMDLGYRRFDIPVRVVFTLVNAGSGLLRLKEVPPVIVRAGC